LDSVKIKKAAGNTASLNWISVFIYHVSYKHVLLLGGCINISELEKITYSSRWSLFDVGAHPDVGVCR
jgi:hypothetical protein